MVLKKSKFGGNTGNTLRNYGCPIPGERSTSFISKQGNDMRPKGFKDDNHEPKEWLNNEIRSKKNEHSLNSSQNVQFSLNRKKNWLLPEALKFEIELESQNNKKTLGKKKNTGSKKKNDKQKYVDNIARVALIEKVSSCKGRHNTSYANHSFTNSVDRNNNRKSKSCLGPLKIPDTQFDMDITYTVEKSFNDSTHWPYHSDGIYKPYKCPMKKYNCFEEIDNYDDYVYDDIDYDDIDEEGDESETFVDIEHYSPKTFGLEVFVKKKSIKDKSCHGISVFGIPESVNPAAHESAFRHDKGSYIVIDKPLELTVMESEELEANIYEIQNDDIDLSVPAYTKYRQSDGKTCKLIECRVNSCEISTEYLARFSKSYVEGNSAPRTFVIFHEHFMQDGVIVSVRVLTGGHTFSTVCIKVFNVTDDFVDCLNELCKEEIFNFDFFVNSCFPIEIKPLNISNCSKRAYHPETVIEKSFKPKAEVIGINGICDNLFLRKQDSVSYDGCFYLALCPICYSIDKLTCMVDCQHYACGDCWRQYLNTKVSSSCYNILCPETGCKQQVDTVTILSFLDFRLIRVFVQKYFELHVQRSCALKFCPSPKCTMIAVYNSPNSSSQKTKKDHVIGNNPCVTCHCKLSWCYNCQKPDHWPSSCFANDKYQLEKKDLQHLYKDNGDVFEIEVVYRICPSCKNPLAKNGGCDHMSCSCGAQFCWKCLRRWSEHVHDPEGCLATTDETVTFTSLDVFGIGIQQKAVEYYLNRRRVLALKTKLKVGKHMGKLRMINHRSNPASSVTDEAFALLINSYKLLENLSVANVVCRSKNVSGRIFGFVDKLSFLLVLLRNSLDVGHRSKLNIGSVVKYVELVEGFMDNLSSLNIKKNHLEI